MGEVPRTTKARYPFRNLQGIRDGWVGKVREVSFARVVGILGLRLGLPPYWAFYQGTSTVLRWLSCCDL